MVVTALLFITPMTRIKLNHMNLLKSLVIFLFSFLLTYAGTEEENELALHHFMQGEFLMNQGNYAMAALEFQEAIELDPNASTIHVSIADAYRRLGKNRRAENHLRTALDLDSEDTEARELLGHLFIVEQKFIDAELEFKILLKSNPENVDYLYTLADLAKLQKKWDVAIDYYIEIFQVNSSSIHGLEQALQISLMSNRFDRAEEVCEFLLAEEPENIKYLETLRDLALFNKNYEKAVETVEIMEKIQGSTTKLLLQKSALYEELNQDQKALSVMHEAFSADSMDIDVLSRFVTLLLDQDENEEAMLYNQRIIDNFNDDPRGFINLAIMALRVKNPKDAIAALNPHVERFPNDYTVQYLLGTSYYQIKDYENAELHLVKALVVFPESRSAKHNLALIYDTIGNWKESDKIYMELITTDSSDAQAFNNYAYSLVERNQDIEFSLELAENAIRLAPKSAAYLDTIGWIYFKMNRLDESLKYIRESLTIDSENSTIRGHFDTVIKAKADQNSQKVQQAENQE